LPNFEFYFLLDGCWACLLLQGCASFSKNFKRISDELMPSFVMRAALDHDNNAVFFVNGYNFVKQTIANLESLRINCATINATAEASRGFAEAQLCS
jgi:hypothetical protein